ncbi:MAG: hypothetical protein WBS24_01860 [Terriglobales bacterium]
MPFALLSATIGYTKWIGGLVACMLLRVWLESGCLADGIVSIASVAVF